MFVFRLKLAPAKKRMLVCAALILALAVFGTSSLLAAGRKPSLTATCDEAGSYSLRAATQQEQEAILASFGLQAVERLESREITVPAVFNDAYTDYNALQQQIGLDLTPYRGETAQRIVFRVKGKKAGRAVLLVKDGILLGGHLTSGVYGEPDRAL